MWDQTNFFPSRPRPMRRVSTTLVEGGAVGPTPEETDFTGPEPYFSDFPPFFLLWVYRVRSFFWVGTVLWRRTFSRTEKKEFSMTLTERNYTHLLRLFSKFGILPSSESLKYRTYLNSLSPSPLSLYNALWKEGGYLFFRLWGLRKIWVGPRSSNNDSSLRKRRGWKMLG